MSDEVEFEDEVQFEWAIEVPGRGWIGWSGFSLTPDFQGFNTLDTAKAYLNDWVKKYASQGFPDVSPTLHVVRRKVTLSKTRWVPEVEGGTP